MSLATDINMSGLGGICVLSYSSTVLFTPGVNQGNNTERYRVGGKEIDAGSGFAAGCREIQGLTAGMVGLAASDKQLGLACIPQSVLGCLLTTRTRSNTYRKLCSV
jgi:hypothetical protein